VDDEDPPVVLPVEDHLDLHAFRPRDVPDVVREYVESAWAQGLPLVRLIHGRGVGVQRAAVHRVLDGHPRVLRFWDAPDSHLGATVAQLTPPAATDPSGSR
jgi:dsDNA-specific endonuclease/ATPase MutS2